MSTPATVPIVAPNGQVGDVPYERMMDAIKAGGKPGVTVKSPDGNLGVIPSDRMSDAVKAGGIIVPLTDQETQHPGFWKNAYNDLAGMAKSFLTPSHMDTDTVQSEAAKMSTPSQSEQAAGYIPLYRGAAALTRGTGIVDPSGMEQSAKEGDEAGVYGHAAAAAAPVVASEVLHATGPAAVKAAKPYFDKVVDTVSNITPKQAAVKAAKPYFDKVVDTVSNITPKQVAQGVGAVSGGAAGHGTLSAPGAYYGAKTAGKIAETVLGPERANQPLIPKSAAPSSPEPDSALGNLPPAAQSPSERLPAAFQPLPRKSPAVPGTAEAPFKPLTELPIPAVNQAISELGMTAPLSALTERANNIDKLGDLLNQGLGGKELEPNVPLRQQLQSSPGATEVKTNVRSARGLEAGGTSELPEPQPRTPAPGESTAVASFHYDPEANELHVTPKGQPSRTYVYGEVSPAQAEMFKAAESKGMAWKSIRDNNPYTAKIIDGKRIPVKPVVKAEDQVSPEEWQAGQELSTKVEGSPR